LRLLLDTHAFLWVRAEPARVPERTVAALLAADRVLVSVVSAWEVEIKIAKGAMRTRETFAEGIADSGFETLGVTLRHVEALRELPAHHRDPFDRMLVAQARAEGATLVTADRDIRAYAVPTMWE